MKKVFIYITTLLISASAFANTGGDDEKKDQQAEPNGRLQPMKIRNRAARPDVPGSLIIDFGFSVLQDAPDGMDMTLVGSRTLNFYYLYDMPIGKSNFVFRPGIGLGMDRYKFDDNNTLTMDSDGDVSITEIDSDLDLKKSHLITNYIDIPVEFMFYANPDDKKRSFNVSVGGKAGIRFSSLTKLKYTEDGNNVKTKDKKDYGLNRFRYGVTGRIGIGGFNFYYYQSLSTLFDEGPDNTDDTSNITVGVSFTGF